MSSLGESASVGDCGGSGVDSESALSSGMFGIGVLGRRGEFLEGALSCGFVGEILIVSRLRGRK